ncbi:hypothetical protein QE152_g30887 [Popillia japonica]|uniref:Uncharacterized protein n=1 Tax=Popillia japonica TaxID=7064 RepID=A0AAW1JDF8_POPJA
MFMVNSVFRKPQPWNDGSSGKLADRFDIGVGTIQTVIHEAAYGKVYAQWIPRFKEIQNSIWLFWSLFGIENSSCRCRVYSERRDRIRKTPKRTRIKRSFGQSEPHLMDFLENTQTSLKRKKKEEILENFENLNFKH